MKMNCNKGGVRARLLTSTLLAGLATVAAPLALTAVVTAIPTLASAQDYSNGSLLGSVRDAAGEPVAGAAVVVKSLSQGFERTVTTDSSGQFRVPQIPLGGYSVAITKDGYQSTSDGNIQVRLGGTSAYGFTLASSDASVSEVVVTATANPQLDFAGTTTGLVIDVDTLSKQVPIARNITALTLLAPSAVPADTAFAIGSSQLQAPASISGASGGENAFFVNGLNITNFINGIGGATVPFDFYKTVEVKTGGYQAEFGRATGGVINAVTKSGTNDFMFAVHGNYAPNKLRATPPNTATQQNSLGSATATDFTVEAGGPIIEDHLFVYGLAQWTKEESTAATTTGTYVERNLEDPFYGIKVDGYLTSRHHLEFTWFDTTRTRLQKNYAFNPATDVINPTVGSTDTLSLGGESYVGRYTGSFTDWLTVSAAYGRSETNQSSVNSLSTVARVQDSRSGITTGTDRSIQRTAATTFPFLAEREFYRGDVDVYFKLLGSHHVRFGYDRENTTLTEQSIRNGGANWTYSTAGATSSLGLAPGQEYLQRRVFISGGGFDGRNEALYIQDAWDLNDRLSLQVGYRQDKFQVSDPNGTPFISFQDEKALRLGATYDVFGDGTTKVFAYTGRYYLPSASNTAFRIAAPAVDFTEFFLPAGGAQTFGGKTPVTGLDARTGLPTAGLGAQITAATGATSLIACPAGVPSVAASGTVACSVRDDGESKDPASLTAANLKSTYEDEFKVGLNHRFESGWTAGATLTYRKLGRVSEDVLLDQGVLAYCKRKGISGCNALATGQSYYLIINPGYDVVANVGAYYGEALPNGETTINLTAADVQLPKVKREYVGLELTFERPFDGKWGLQGSYVLSESKGNFEGALKSDTGQTDAGIVSDFDFLSFIPGQYGLLPNHHAHQFKLFGSYAVNDNLLFGSNMSVISPRKYGCIGLAPIDYANGDGGVANDSYGVENARFCGGKIVGRGSAFAADWVSRVDLSVRYTVPKKFSRAGDLVLRADVFNIFNSQAVQEAYEFGETDGGTADEDYGRPTAYQAPRSVRVGFDWQF